MKAIREHLMPELVKDFDQYVKKFEDPVKFNGIAIPVYTYNIGVSTKYTVNLVLFYMTVSTSEHLRMTNGRKPLSQNGS
jgi:hypothetical protein